MLQSLYLFLFMTYVHWYAKFQVWKLMVAMYYANLKKRLITTGERFTTKKHTETELYEVYDSHKDAHFIFSYNPKTHDIEERILDAPPFISLGLKYEGDEEYVILDKWHSILVKGNRLTKEVMRHVYHSHGHTPKDDVAMLLMFMDKSFIIHEINLDTHEITLGDKGNWIKDVIACE